MILLAEDLARLCYNAIQFSAKDSQLKGCVMFGFSQVRAYVFASDDYVAMKDDARATAVHDETFFLGLKEVKELEKWLRDKTGEVILMLDPEGLLAVVPGADSGYLQIVSEPPDFSMVVEVATSDPNPFTGEWNPSAEPFAIRAERFTKFRLLRTPESPSRKDGYPVDFIWDGGLIRWKCGPFLRGVIGPLARRSFVDPISGVEVTGIKDLYAEESEVLW